MHAIHTTPGFIIESRPLGEAGKLLSIFTRDLGLVWAIAQGIRLEKSKLRYHSQEYSFGEFSFVRGKEFWRLTSAGEVSAPIVKGCLGGDVLTSQIKSDQNLVTFYDEKTECGSSREVSEIVGRTALLFRRLLHGEEPHPELFNEIKSAADFLDAHGLLSIEQLQTFETLVVFRVLKLLGYIGADKGIGPEFSTGFFSIELLDAAFAPRKTLNMHINKALKESHL